MIHVIGYKNWFNKTKFNPGNNCTGDSNLNKCQIPDHLELKSLAVTGERRGGGFDSYIILIPCRTFCCTESTSSTHAIPRPRDRARKHNFPSPNFHQYRARRRERGAGLYRCDIAGEHPSRRSYYTLTASLFYKLKENII